MAAPREKLIAQGVDAALIDRVKAPAGLDLAAITPEEIAMSILAEITLERRERAAQQGRRLACDETKVGWQRQESSRALPLSYCKRMAILRFAND